MDRMGAHRIPAPLHKTWAALHDPLVLGDCSKSLITLQDLVPEESCRIQIQTPAHETLSGTLRLQREGAFTLLTVVPEDPVAPGAAQALDHFLDCFTAEVASPREMMAEGAAGMAEAATHLSARRHNPPALVSALAVIPAEPFGYPIAFWLGSGVFLVILLLVLSAYW